MILTIKGVFMNLKKFEYQNKDVPFLKKDVIFRILFAVLFVAVFVWQIVSLFLQYSKSSLNVAMIISTIIVLLTSLLFALLSILYALKDLRIVSVVNKRGRSIDTVSIMFNTEKKGFLNLYKIINEVLAVLSLLVLIFSLTYSVLEFYYFSAVSYYMPVLLLIVVSGFNASYHLNTEIATIQTVQEFNKIY